MLNPVNKRPKRQRPNPYLALYVAYGRFDAC
jgi:hypothetical protein